MLLIFGIITSTLPNHPQFQRWVEGSLETSSKKHVPFLVVQWNVWAKDFLIFPLPLYRFWKVNCGDKNSQIRTAKKNMSSQILKRGHFNGKIVLRTCDLSGNILVSSEVTSEVIQETPMRDLMLDLPWKEYPSPKRKPKDLKKHPWTDWT